MTSSHRTKTEGERGKRVDRHRTRLDSAANAAPTKATTANDAESRRATKPANDPESRGATTTNDPESRRATKPANDPEPRGTTKPANDPEPQGAT